MRKLTAVVLAAVFILALAGCGKKKEQAQSTPEQGAINVPAPGGEGGPPTGMPPGGEGAEQGMPVGMGQSSAPKQVVVPEDVKNTWTAAKIAVKKKDGSLDKIYEVAPGKSIEIAGSKLKVEVGQYLPDFTMDGQSITSKSNEPINPTVRMTIYDGDKEIYKGWAFEKYPEAHSFNHPDYSVTLLGGVKK